MLKLCLRKMCSCYVSSYCYICLLSFFFQVNHRENLNWSSIKLRKWEGWLLHSLAWGVRFFLQSKMIVQVSLETVRFYSMNGYNTKVIQYEKIVIHEMVLKWINCTVKVICDRNMVFRWLKFTWKWKMPKMVMKWLKFTMKMIYDGIEKLNIKKKKRFIIEVNGLHSKRLKWCWKNFRIMVLTSN